MLVVRVCDRIVACNHESPFPPPLPPDNFNFPENTAMVQKYTTSLGAVIAAAVAGILVSTFFFPHHEQAVPISLASLCNKKILLSWFVEVR